MSWITIAESDVVTKLSGPELAAMKTAALQSGQSSPLTAVIAQVVREIRGYVGGCAQNRLGEGDTVPDELLGAAIARIRFELATRLPVPGLLTDDRRTANSQALALLRDVSACKFALVQPTTATSESIPGGNSVAVVTAGSRRASRTQLDGL